MIPSGVGCCHQEPQLYSGWLLAGFQIGRNGVAAESLLFLLPSLVSHSVFCSLHAWWWLWVGAPSSSTGSSGEVSAHLLVLPLSLTLGSMPSLRFTFGSCIECLLLVVWGGWSHAPQHPVLSQMRHLLVPALCRAMSLLEEVLALEWGSIMGMGLCEAVGQLRLWAAFSGADSQGGRAFLQTANSALRHRGRHQQVSLGHSLPFLHGGE